MIGNNIVLIEYEDNKITSYLVLSGFMKMCGYQVVGQCIEEKNVYDCEKYNNFDLKIFIRDLNFIQDNNNIQIIFEKQKIIINTKAVCLQDCYKILEELIYKMSDNEIESESTIRGMELIKTTYINNDLSRHEYNSQYFFYNREIAIDAYNYFEQAVSELQMVYDRELNEYADANIVFMIRFAMCYCVKRVLEMADAHALSKNYNIHYLKNILILGTRYGIAKISSFELIGDIMATDIDCGEIAMKYYKQYFELIQTHICTNEVYYRAGRLIEKMHSKSKNYSIEDAFWHYNRSYTINRMNYRAGYKVGVHYGDKLKNGLKAYHIYKYVIDMLEEKIGSKRFQPLELEYLFKLKFKCGRLFVTEIRNSALAKKYFEEAEALQETKLESIPFLRVYHDEKAQEYLEMGLSRMPKYQIRANKIAAESEC